MSKNNDNKLVPKLRFPEFINDAKWSFDTVENLISTISPPKKLNSVEYLATGKFPIVDQSQKFYCGWTNDNNAIINDSLPLIIFGDHTCILKLVSEPFAQGADGIKIIKPNNTVTTEFLFHYLNYNGVQQENYKRHFSILKDKLVFYPNIKNGEQQKIAACLSSLDDVIEAESQKLELLKEHKKGLLQNLFPQEGEKVPKLRFKEFEDRGEWDEKELGSFCTNLSSGKDKNVIDGEYELYGSTGIIGRTENASYEGDFILVARVGANAGLLNKVKGKFGVTDNTLVIDLVKKDLINFIFYSLESVGLNKLVFGSGQPLITGGQLKNFSISIPSSEQEQKKIPNTLSSIDDLIKAQSKKIEALKLHKKGLLQGLFPDINEENPSNSMEVENDRN
jgi:type I restriction enzyme S subunit